MTDREFAKKLQQHATGIAHAMNRTIPVKVGRMAENLFKDNFRKSGFVDGGVQAWERSKRIGASKDARGSYKTLMSGRQHLYSSIKSKPGKRSVIITNDVPYARVHNEGLKAGRGDGFTMPKRQVIGESKELSDGVKKIMDTEINNIINK